MPASGRAAAHRPRRDHHRSPLPVHVRRSNRRQPRRPRRTQPDHASAGSRSSSSLFLAGRRGHRARSRPSASTPRSRSGLPDPRDARRTTSCPRRSIIYDRTGKIELARFGDAQARGRHLRRDPAGPLDATTAVEDKTFWDNAGFDPVAIVVGRRSTRSAATAAAPRRSPSSSSAQRLLDPALVQDPHRTAERKLKEIIQSIRLTEAYPGVDRQADRSSPPTSTRTTTATRPTA